jgi:O-antigen/teichoic acid export membrane protein
MAAFIPKTDKMVESVIYLGLCLATFFSVLLIVFFYIKSDWLLHQFKFKDAHLLFFIPLGVLVVSYYNLLRAWLNRIENYRQIRKNTILQSSVVGISQVAIGVIKNLQAYGLIMGDLTGKLLTTLSIFFSFYRVSGKFRTRRGFYVFTRFITIPTFQVPAALANNAAIYAPYVLLPTLFSETISGFYFLVYRIVMMPISLVGTEMTDVFRADCAKNINQKGECYDCFKNNLIALLLIALPVYVVLQFGGKFLFTYIFGKQLQKI